MSLEEKDLHRDIFKKATLIHIDRFQRLLKDFFHKRSLTLPFLLGEVFPFQAEDLVLNFPEDNGFFASKERYISLFHIRGAEISPCSRL